MPKVPRKLARATSQSAKAPVQPHFAIPTQSSLMKERTRPTKSSSMEDASESKKSQGGGILKLNRIHRKRNGVTKQSRGMQMLIMVLKQNQRDRRTTVYLPGGDLAGTTCQLDSTLISLKSDLIKDVSCDLKKISAGSPVKVATRRGGSRVVSESSSFRAEDSHVSPQDGSANCAGKDNSENIPVPSEKRTLVNVTYQLRSIGLRSIDEDVPADPRCEVDQDLCHPTETEEKPDDPPNRDRSEIEARVHPPRDLDVATSGERTLTYGKAEGEHVDVDRACHADSQGPQSVRLTKHVGNPRNNSANDRPIVSGATVRKRAVLQRNLASNQRVWRPPGAPKTWVTESATSLRPISQKSSQSEKSTASTKSKHSSTERIESFSSDSTGSSANQSKMPMKENRDPQANRMTKVYEHLAAVKQRQRLQSGGTPKKKRSRTKIGPALVKRDDTKSLSKSKLPRYCQARSVTPKKSLRNLNNVGQRPTKSVTIYNRSKTLEVIHTMKNIGSVRKDEDAEKNVKGDDLRREKKNDSEIQTSSNSDTSQISELRIPTKNTNLDEADRPSRRSISTQTELDSPSACHEIDAERDQDLKKIFKLETRIVATQTSPISSRNAVEIGCNTSVAYNDAEVSCDLIGSTNLKEVDPTVIEDKSMLNVDSNENKGLLLSECKETLNAETSLKLENCDSAKNPAKATNDAAREIEKITLENACQISQNSIDIDQNQKSAKCSSVNNTSVNSLFLERSRSSIYDHDASCFSEEIVERPENDVRCEDMVTSELKVEDIPSDVVVAFELAAERARNLHEAVIIYHKNLMSRESGKRNEEKITVEDCETSEFRDENSLVNRENINKIKTELEAMCHLMNNEDFGGFSTCSSRGSSSDQRCGSEFSRSSRNDRFGVRREESVVLSENERARSNLNERSDLEDVKSLMQLVHRSEEDYALELLESEKDESFDTERNNYKTLALPAAVDRDSFISRENMFPFICCIVCTVIFWFLQFSFRCDSKK